MPRSGPDRLSTVLRAAGVLLLVVAAVAIYLATRPPPDTFLFGQSEFVDRWNRVASSGLEIGDVQWTDREAGVLGFAFTPTLSVLARVEGPFDQIGEIAVVGRPELDGRALVQEAMLAVVAVTEPSLSRDERRGVLSDLGLTGDGPADPDSFALRGDTRYRAAADPARGVIGIGAVPIGAVPTAAQAGRER